MAARSEVLDYFALSSLVEYLWSLCLSLKMDHQRLVFWSPRRLHSVHKTVALGRVVPPKRHLKLENVLLQVIALERGVLRLIRRAFCNDACYIYYVWNAEPVRQSRRRPPQQKFVVWVHKFPGGFFTVMTSHMSMVISTNEAVPKLSPLKIWSQNLKQFCKYDQKYNT